VGTVAVDGVSVTAIPESSMRVAVPVFFVSAAAVATTLIESPQTVCVEVQFVPASFVRSGTVCGAVKTTVVFAELAGMFPVSELQGVEVPVWTFPLVSTKLVA